MPTLRRKVENRIKIWSSAVADKKFSEFIRKRDGKCVRCGKTEYLQCSHFWSRGRSSVRYDPENADALCYGCHYGNAQGWEYEKQGEYMDFKKLQLGQERYDVLEKRAHTIVSRKDAIIKLMSWLSPTPLA